MRSARAAGRSLPGLTTALSVTAAAAANGRGIVLLVTAHHGRPVRVAGVSSSATAGNSLGRSRRLIADGITTRSGRHQRETCCKPRPTAACSRCEVNSAVRGPITGPSSPHISRHLVFISSGGAGRAMATAYCTVSRGLSVCARTRRSVGRRLLDKTGARPTRGRSKGSH